MNGLSRGLSFPRNSLKQQNGKDERGNLAVKSRLELMDLLQREEKLCKNTKFLEKLPDKGAKILKFYEEVKTELRRRDNQERLCGELAKLTVDDSKNALDRLEWTGDYRTDPTTEPCEEDDTNLFRILATHSSTEVSKQKNIKCESEDNGDSLNIEVYAKQLCERFDSNSESSTRKKFYTHKPLNRTSITRSDEHEAARDSTVPASRKNVENSTSKVKTLSLQESLAAQHQQNKLLKEIEFHSAIEKLRTKIDLQCRSFKVSDLLYRDQSDANSDDEEPSDALSEESDY